jgi:DNA modification methylase
MGSGSTGIASVKLGRNFIGNDIGSEALKVARDRLQDLQIDFVSTFWPKQT